MTRPMGFFTDSSICIGCKACEVACKEWNELPVETADLRFLANSYDNTGRLDADHWRHVAFVEQARPDGVRWLMSSNVCKHCVSAACLDVCPTGALFRTEFDSVVVQEDVCNGCGYCVPACPFGVIRRRERDGRAWKCTLCYDRQRSGLEPACATACPTKSIQFGPVDELRRQAADRVAELRAAGETGARLYGTGDGDGTEEVGGCNAFFLLLDEPAVYGLPDRPRTPTKDLRRTWGAALLAAGALAAGLAAACWGRGR